MTSWTGFSNLMNERNDQTYPEYFLLSTKRISLPFVLVAASAIFWKASKNEPSTMIVFLNKRQKINNLNWKEIQCPPYLGKMENR